MGQGAFSLPNAMFLSGCSAPGNEPVQLTERLVWEREQAYLKKFSNWLVSASSNEKWR